MNPVVVAPTPFAAATSGKMGARSENCTREADEAECERHESV